LLLLVHNFNNANVELDFNTIVKTSELYLKISQSHVLTRVAVRKLAETSIYLYIASFPG